MYRFMVCELKTGLVLDEVPFTISGDLSRNLQGFGTGTLELPVLHPECPGNWEQLILPWRNLILVLDEHDNIVWHGIPNREGGMSVDTVSYPCVTIEGYMLRRYVPTMNFNRVDQADIARTLAAVCGDAVGIPLQYDCPRTGVIRDKQYSDDENAFVYNRLQELAALVDGFNWTVDVEWADQAHTRVQYTFRTGYPHLGNRSENPEHVFDMPGNVTDFEYDHIWSDGDAATHVRAIGDGQGDLRVMSPPIVDELREAAGWPRLEERRSFSGVTEAGTILSHARKVAAQLFGGQELVTLTAHSGAGTEIGDLTLGDSVLVTIASPARNASKVMTVVGWTLQANSGTYKPTLAVLEDA